MTRRKRVMITTAVVVTFAFSSCAWFSPHSRIGHSPRPAHNELFAVTAEKTSFYRYGPQQGRGPDRDLTRDTLVTLIRHSFGYSKVKLDDGEQGFVANEDLVK